eukprot:35422-Eustigmatos_ZCMA.PRE.1
MASLFSKSNMRQFGRKVSGFGSALAKGSAVVGKIAAASAPIVGSVAPELLPVVGGFCAAAAAGSAIGHGLASI